MVKTREKKHLNVQKVSTHIFLLKEIECKCDDEKTKAKIKGYCIQNNLDFRETLLWMKTLQKIPQHQLCKLLEQCIRLPIDMANSYFVHLGKDNKGEVRVERISIYDEETFKQNLQRNKLLYDLILQNAASEWVDSLEGSQLQKIKELFQQSNSQFEELKISLIKKLLNYIDKNLNINKEEHNKAIKHLQEDFSLQSYIDIVVPVKRQN